MTDAKVQAVVANWYPRFLANGIDYFDLSRTLDAVDGWDDWADAWTATADRYDALGREALAEGHRVTAAEHLRRAALTLQFAQFVLTEDPPRRAALQARMSALYAEAAPLLDPPARAGDACRTATADGRRATCAVPDGVARPGLAVLVPGLESTKEQFSTYEPFFLRRGVATLSVEGPGQGEGALSSPFRTDRYAAGDGRGRRGDRRAGRDRRGPGRRRRHQLRRAPGARATPPRSRACAASSTSPAPTTCARSTSCSRSPATASAIRGRRPTRRRPGTCSPTSPSTARSTALDVPVLVVHGERDTIIRIEHAHRIAAALGDRATVRLEPDGNHSCNNLATVVRPAVADWVTDRLESAHD